MTDSSAMVESGYVPWSPITSRPRLLWPGSVPVAVCFLVHIEYASLEPRGRFEIPRSLTHRGPYPFVPDLHEVTPHEYGNRVGLLRVARLLDDYGIKASAPMDGYVATSQGPVVAATLAQGWELLGHAPVSNEVLSEALSAEEEAAYIADALSSLHAVLGHAPRGWAGVDYQESSRTVELLADAGIEYVCDWPNDEQPYRMTVLRGSMTALPVSIHLDDIFAMRMRGVDPAVWSANVCAAFDRLCEDGRISGRTLVLGLHPWFIGQPLRIGYLAEVVRHICESGQAWIATGGEIVDWYGQQVTTGG
ncbi:hypothetical protein ACWEP4_28430 [Streptomyces sp. NPDC004227]